MRLHPDLAWITPFTNWICGKPWFRRVPPALAYGVDRVLHRCPTTVVPSFLQGPYDGALTAPTVLPTHEGHSIWNRFCRDQPHHACTAEDVTPPARADLPDVVRWHLRYHRRPRFVSKTPRNALRMPFFQAVFPDARFIHLVRDGRAVAASILKMRRTMHGSLEHWWGARPPGWREVRAEPPMAQAAWMWTTFLDTIAHSGARLPENAIHTVHYEQLTQHPRETLTDLFETVGLDPERFFRTEHARLLHEIRPPHEAWRDQLSPAQKKHLNVLTPTLRAYGYETENS
jgi:hypothetical protein